MIVQLLDSEGEALLRKVFICNNRSAPALKKAVPLGGEMVSRGVERWIHAQPFH